MGNSIRVDVFTQLSISTLSKPTPYKKQIEKMVKKSYPRLPNKDNPTAAQENDAVFHQRCNLILAEQYYEYISSEFIYVAQDKDMNIMFINFPKGLENAYGEELGKNI
jgi:hypothetical protein